MSKVTEIHPLSARVVTDEAEIEELTWFQLGRYLDHGIIDEMPPSLAPDESVEQSTHFAVYAGDKLHACAQLITKARPFPVLSHHRLYPSAQAELDAAGDQIAEVARLAVGRDAPHYRALGLLAREIFHYCLHHQETTILVASIDKPVVRILEQVLGIPIEIIGEELTEYGDGLNGSCAPVLIDTARYVTEPRWSETRNWKFFTDGLDLAASPTSLTG